MPSYRVYCLDGAGKVWAAEWIEADDDAAALEAARQFTRAVQCEVWQGQRAVGRVALKPGQVEEGEV
ncbi:MAG TPA: hypothetical protein VFH89_08705 [Sphingomicrobium sp.]|nr:hypothetical protein [Sphingomicrobium sp.]